MASTNTSDMRNLTGVILISIITAFVITAYFLYYYGPSGSYLVRHALVSPENIEEFNYNDTNLKTGGMDRFVFDKIEFREFDEKTKNWASRDIPVSAYSQFWNAIKNENSLVNPPGELKQIFIKPAKLVIVVRTESSAAWQYETKDFQTVDFSDTGDYYRVELHEQNAGENWAYYQHNGIFEYAKGLFAK